MKLEFNPSEIEAVIDLIVKRTMKMDMHWDWPCGVAYYGIAKAYETLKKDEYLQLLKIRIDELIELGVPSQHVNTCAMGHALLTLYEATGEKIYKELIFEKLEYLSQHALRFGDHVLQHTVSDKDDFPAQCWADTLFMAALFMLRAGKMFDNEAWKKDALNQWYWHITYLQNEKNGLWYHGYSHATKSHLSGFHWGRANAWAAYTMSQVRPNLEEWYLYPETIEVWGSLDEQLVGLKTHMTEKGLIRTIIDDPESYEEISASAGIGAAMLATDNPLYIKYINQTVKGILENVDEFGKVCNVSGGTAVMKDLEGYRNITKKWIQGWGQGLTLVFLSYLLIRGAALDK
jgi:unsaturated rhamnogalacturonyl hydrolase